MGYMYTTLSILDYITLITQIVIQSGLYKFEVEAHTTFTSSEHYCHLLSARTIFSRMQADTYAS